MLMKIHDIMYTLTNMALVAGCLLVVYLGTVWLKDKTQLNCVPELKVCAITVNVMEVGIK